MTDSATATATVERPIDVGRLTLPRAGVVAISIGLVALALARFGLTAEAVVVAAFFVVLAVLTAIDLRDRRLPNVIVLPSVVVALVAQSLVFPARAPEWLLSAVLAAVVLVVPALINPAGMGMGDVKLALLLGAMLGRDVVDAMLIAFLSIVPVALVLFLRHGEAARKATLPLGPFLAAGAVVALLLGGPREATPTGVEVKIERAGASR